MENKSIGQKKTLPARKRKARQPSTIAPIVHVVIRVRSEEGNTIATHRQVIAEYGHAMFAKIGKGLGPAFIEELNSQINRGIITYCFVAIYEGRDVPFGIYQCELLSVHTDLKDAQKKLIPKYLQSVIKGISTWFEIRTLNRVAQEERKRISVISSGREISGAMKGMTAVFRVGVTGSAAMKVVSDPTRKSKNPSDFISTEFDDDLVGNDNEDYSFPTSHDRFGAS